MISYFKCSSMNRTSRVSKETLALLNLRTPAFYLITNWSKGGMKINWSKGGMKINWSNDH